jgi:hypothetical protein
MALDNFSIFYYGHEITVSNNIINFDEGGGELAATLEVGFYSLTDFAIEVQRALNDAGALTYTVSVNRTTRLITISAGSNFSLLFDTGTQAAVAPFTLLGFDEDDFTGASTYTGTLPSGSQYVPQFRLQNYSSSDDNISLIDAVVNKSANGRVQVVRFGTERFFEMAMKYLTNTAMDGQVILNNPNGLADARDFFEYAVNKAPMEFMPSISARSTFYKVLLESTPESRDGVAYKLKEMVNQNIPGLYETGNLKFRLLED